MPSLATLQASVPRCDRVTNQMSTGPLRACDKPLRWYAATDPMDGVWTCPEHGPMMDGVDAALRAGFLSVVVVEPAG